MSDLLRYKKCIKCKQEKQLDQFHRKKLSKDGRRSECKECRANNEIAKAKKREYMKRRYKKMSKKLIKYNVEWNKNHKDARKKIIKLYYIKNKEKVKERNIRWKTLNKDKDKIYRKKYREQNRDRYKMWNKIWAKNNPIKAKAIKARRRKRILNALGSFTVKDIQQLMEHQKGFCYWCGSFCANNYHIDHIIPLSKGGTNYPTNLCIACPTCNLKKSDKMPEEFIREIAI